MTGKTYSVLRGNYSRVFTGHTEGWSAPQGVLPSAEEIAAHIPEIADPSHWDEPQSGIDEGDIATARLDRRYGS